MPTLCRSAPVAFVLMAVAACAEEPTGPPTPVAADTVTVGGRVVTADGEAVPPGVVRLRWGSLVSEGPLASDGTFAVRAAVDAGDSVAFEIRGDRYHPSWKLLPPPLQDTDLTVLLIPAAVELDAGTYEGLEVPVSLQNAFAPENLVSGDGDFFHLQRPDPRWGDASGSSLQTRSWPEDRFPLRVYFEHDGSLGDHPRAPVSGADSAVVWSVLEDLEERLGWDAFEPAVKQSLLLDAPETQPLFAISISVVPDLPVGGYAGAHDACSADMSAGTCDHFRDGTLVAGWVGLRAVEDTSLGAFLVQHEMIHALGFGHACFYPTIMTPCLGPWTLQRLDPLVPYESRATPHDVANIQLYRLMHRRTHEIDFDLGIVEALEGERLVRGLGRLPQEWHPPPP